MKTTGKRILKVAAIVLILNLIVIFFSAKSGLSKGDMMLRFRERQAVTFLSALLLGLISLISSVIYLLKKKIQLPDKGFRFWLFASIGFFYLCMDEYFMAHEGMDEAVGALFGKDIKHLNLDGLTIGFFGLIAFGVCYYFRKEILRQKEILPFLFLGAFGLLGTVVFHMLERINIVYEVIEEGFKILGVSFFFAGFLVTLLSLIKKLYIYMPSDTNSKGGLK